MKDFTFDLQRFDTPTFHLKWDSSQKAVIGYSSDTTATTDLFKITGVDTDAGLTFAAKENSSDVGVVTVASDAAAFNDTTITITKLNENGTYTLAYGTADAGKFKSDKYTWSLSGTTAKYDHDGYYTLTNSNTTLTYTKAANEVTLKLGATITDTELLKSAFDVNKGSYTITVKALDVTDTDGTSDGFLSSAATITGGRVTYTFGNLTSDISTFTATNEHLTIDSDNGTVTISGNWNAGYNLTNNKTLAFKAAASDVVLASITKLAKSTIATDGGSDSYLSFTADSDVVTFKNAALSKDTVKITNAKNPAGVSNQYKLALDTDARLVTAGGSITDTNIWEVNSSNQATFKNVTPTHYILRNSDTEISQVAEDAHTTYGIIKYPVITNVPPTASNVALIDAGNQSDLLLSYSTVAGGVSTEVGITAAAIGTDASQGFTFTVNDSVLPKNGTSIKLSGTHVDASKFVLGDVGPQTALSDTQPSWTFTNGNGVLKAKLSNGYILADNDKTIKNAMSGTAIPVVTISNLSSNVTDTSTATLGAYLSIEGYDSDTAPVGKANGGIGSTDTITITLKKAALSVLKSTIDSPTDSFKYEFALDSDAKLTTNDGTIATDTNIWVFNGDKATYKHVTPEHYTLDTDTGKIIYNKQADIANYAIISGLNSAVIGSTDTQFTSDGSIVYTERTTVEGFDVSDTLLMQVSGSDIKLGAAVLKTGNVTLSQGSSGQTYQLGLFTEADSNTAVGNVNAVTSDVWVQSPDITQKWWTFASDAGTATLHQRTQEGYIRESGNLVKYFAATSDSDNGKTLATISGLSTDVKVFKANGTFITASASVTDTQLGVSLGITSDTRAHTTWNAEGGSFIAGTDQTITLTDAMLNKKKVSLADKDSKDSDTFKLAFTTDNEKGIPATDAVLANSWTVGGDSDTTTLTYQEYNKGYYTKTSDNIIDYTKDGAKTKLFNLTVTKSGRTLDAYNDVDGVINVGTDTFVTVGSSEEKVVTLTQYGASTDTGNAIAFKAIDNNYKDYTLEADDGVAKVQWSSSDTWKINGTNATFSIKPGTNGYELSADGSTLNYRNTDVAIFSLSGLKTGVTDTDFAKVTYDKDEKTLTLTQDVLGTGKIELTPTVKNDSYTLNLDEDVPQEGVHGYTWANVTTPGTITVNDVTRDYYTKKSDTKIEYNKEVKHSTLFTISGLKATSITSEFTDKDGDNVLNAAFTDTNISVGAELLTFDTKTKVVSITNEAILDSSSDGSTITLSKGWSFDTNSFTAPSFKSAGQKWSISGDDVVLTIPAANVTPGYKISPNGQTLTYVAASDQTLLKISGLNMPAEADSEAFLTSLNAAFDGESTVTLPQSVLGTANKIKLTPNDKNDSFILMLDSEVRQTGVDGYSWTKSGSSETSYSLVLKNVTQEYWTSDSATAFTYHKEAEKKKLFTLSGSGLTSYVVLADTDKDGNTVLNDSKDNEFVSVDTKTGKVTLNTNIVHNAKGDNGKSITIKNGNSDQTYTFASGTDLETLAYGNYSWATESGAAQATLQAEATTAGFILSDNNTKFTYVAQYDANDGKVQHSFLELKGINTDTALSISGNAANATFDEDENTVTLTKDVLNQTKVSIKSLNGNTYTLKLDPDTVNQSAKSGYTWELTSGTGTESDTRIVTAKAVTQEYYSSDTSGTAFSYTKEKLDQTLFTISGLTNLDTDTALNDKDADNALTKGNNTYISFDTVSKKVMLNEGILPISDTKTVTISGKSSYTLSDDDITQPSFNDSNVKWTTVGTDTTSTLSVTPESVGWEFSKSNTVITRVADERTLATLSGLAKGLSSDTLKSGIEVSIDDKTISMFKSVLDNTSKITVDKASGYKLTIGDSEVQVGKNNTAQDVWQLGATDASTGLTAYYRNVYPEYYTIGVNSDTIIYTKPEKKTEYVTIKGLATDATVNGDGAIIRNGSDSLIEVYADSSNTNTKVISIALDALGTDATIASGKNYKFELADDEAKLNSQTWSYTSDGTITVTGHYATGALVSADGQSINVLADNETDQTLATLTGLKKSLPFTGVGASDISKHFTFDADAKTITFTDDTFFTNTKVSVSGAFFNYTLALGDELNTDTKKKSTEWSVTVDTDTYAATATYKGLTEAAYTLDTKTGKAISTQMEKADSKAITQITGLQFASSDVSTVSGSDINAFSVKYKTAGTTAEDVVVIDTSTGVKTITLKDDVLPTGTDTVTIKANNSYKFVIDDDVKTEVEYSDFKANQAAQTDTSMVIKATAGAYYDLTKATNGTITYKPATETTIATLTGLKTTDAAITNAAITNNQTPIGHGIFVDTDEKTITVDDNAMNGSDVSISTTHSYTLALNDEQNSDAYDTWSIATGTAVFKQQTPHYYSIDTKTNKIKSIKEAVTKTYFTITGLSTATDSSKLLVSSDSNGSFIAASDAATTSVVTFDGNDTITLGLKALPANATDTTTIKVAKGKNGTASYKLALAENMPVTTFVEGSDTVIGNVASWGVASEGTKALSLSGNKVVYSAPIKAGYTLSTKGDEIVVANGTKNKEYFTISGLDVTSATNLATSIEVSNDNVVKIHQDVLGTSRVSISNSEYTLDLADDVDQNHDLEEYAQFKNGTLYVKQGESEYYSINSKGEIVYTGEKNAKQLATVTGLKSELSDTQINALVNGVDLDNKVINITSDVVTASSVAIGTGKNTYALAFNNITTGSQNTWTVSNGTAILNAISSSDTWTLAADGNSIAYTKAGGSTQILKLSGLGNVSTDSNQSDSFTTTNHIQGVSVASLGAAEDGVTPLTVTIGKNVLNNKDVSVTTTNSNYNPHLALADSINTSSDTVTAWNWNKKNDEITFAYQNTVPVYYTFKDEDSTTAKYHSSSSVDLVTISGKGFNSGITSATDATTALTAFGNYATIASGENDVPTLQISTDTGLTYLTSTDTSKSVTITTKKVNGVTYDVEIESGKIATTGDNKWSLSGNSLVLSKALSEGYKLSGGKLSYAASDTTGSKIFTISGLDLTDAKAAMTNYDSDQTNTINTASSTVIAKQNAYDAAVAEYKADKSDANKTAQSNASSELTAAKTALANAIASIQSYNFNAYLSDTSLIEVSDDEPGVTIGSGLLGTSNVSITKNGTESYTLSIAESGVTTEEPDQSLEWSFSGGTATLKQTRDKYYTYDSDTNQIKYNKPVTGDTAVTIKGLATKKLIDTSSKTVISQVSGSPDTNTSKHTVTNTTTDTYIVYSNTQVVTLSGGGEIGTVNITDSQIFTTTTVTVTYLQSDNTTVDTTKTPKVTTTSKKSSITSGSPGAFTAGIAEADGVIKLSQSVLGTSSVTLTNGKVGGETQAYSLAVSEASVEPATTNTKWTGSLGGTSAVFKGNISAGYTLENDENPTKITYSAAKNDAALLTVSGIKIPTTIVSGSDTITSASDSDTRNNAIATWLNTNVSIGSAEDGVAEVTVKAEALNEKDVTAKSGSTTTYTLVLDNGVADEAETVSAWNGWNYQSYSSGYYSEVAKTGSIKYIKDGKATILATVKGLKGKYDESMGTETTLTIDAAHLGTGTVSVSGTGATITLKLADDVATVDAEREKTGDWATNGTTASKRDGIPAHYTLVENVITYHKESGAKKTFATITGLKAGATVDDNNGVVTLTSEDLDKTTVKIANGKDAGDTNYTLTLDKVSNPKFTQLENEYWQAKGVNATLKGNIEAGYDLSADKKSVLYTASATGKALATFTFANSNTATATLTDKVIGLANSTGNKKITVKTNPYGLTIKPTGFSGTSTSDRVMLVGSGAADAFDISGLSNIALSGGAGDDLVSLGTTAKSGVSIGGGAGNDSIYGTGGTDLIILGDAGNDTINITDNAEKVNGGAGNDYLSVANAVNVIGDAGNDTINVTGTVSVLSAGAGNDSVKVASAGAIDIKGDAGNDYIEITGNANGTKIYGGAGNDTILIGSGSTSVSVVGEAGNDVIEFNGSNGTINGGAGNDSISIGSGAAVKFFYASGNGSDSVTGWSDDDTFVLNSGEIAKGKASIGGDSNADLILTIGSGKVTLFGAANGKNEGDTWNYTSGTDTSKSITLVGGNANSGDIVNDINSLIYEDNNLITPNDISDLVKTNSITEYHVGNYNNIVMAPDQILSDSDNISYGNQQKKNNK